MKVVFFQRKPFPKGNFSVEILCEQIKSNLPQDISVSTYTAKYHSKGLIKRLYIMIAAVFRQGDVNHVTGDVNFLSILLSPKKTILTVLDVAAVSHPNKIAQYILHLFWLHIPVRRVGYITTISKASKDELLKIVNIPKEKVRVLYIPVSSYMKYTPKEFDDQRPVVLHIGTGSNKNLPRLAMALQGIRCKLEIIGELSIAQIAVLKENQIDYNDSFNLSNEEMREKYEKADLLSFASTYEGFGMPIVEAQIVGRPVLTGNVLSMPEVAGDGAHLVDPYNITEIREGILKIINDKDYRNTLVEKGIKNATRFSAKKLAKEYANLYQEVCTRGN